MLRGVSGGALGESIIKRSVGAQLAHGRRDARRICLLKHVSVDAVAQRRPEISPRQYDGSADRKKFRQLRGEAIIIKRIRLSGLHKNIRERHQWGQMTVMMNLTQPHNVGGNFLGDLTEKIHSVQSCAQQDRCVSGPIECQHRRVECPHLSRIRGMDVAMIKQNRGRRR